MIKSDMTKSQLTKRSDFICELIKAKWDPRGWETLFDNDIQLLPEAQAEYQNVVFNLRLSYFVEEDYIFLECIGRKDSTLLLKLRLYPGSNPATVTAKIIEYQDNLSPDNYTNLIKELILLCPIVALETPEGLVRVS